MRTFIDMAIRPPVGQPKVRERMAALARQIGLSVVCLRFTEEASSSEIEFSVRVFRDAGLEVAIGVDISPTSRKQLLNRLRTLRSAFDIVAVKSADTRTVGIAARDGRVDLISLEPQKSFRAKQSILKTCKSNLELELSRIIRSPIQSPNESARTIFGEVELARRHDVDVVVSSGADNQFGLRAPIDAASLAVTFGLPKESSLDAVSEIPLNIVRRNWDRLSGRSIGPGITLARSQD